MDQLVAAAETTELDAHNDRSSELFAVFQRLVEDATFVRLEPDRRKTGDISTRLNNADGIVRPTKPGKVEYLLFNRTFAAWFPEVAPRKRLAKLLRAKRIFKVGRRSDTNTR